jgi:hypothetical protein
MFGAPPVSIVPLQDYGNEGSGSGSRAPFFLSLINDSDPIIKADVGYFTKKYCPIVYWCSPSLAEGSRSDCRIAHVPNVAAMRLNRLFVNSGNIVLMKIDTASPSRINIKRVSNSELDEDAVGLLKVHSIKVYGDRIASIFAANLRIEPSVSAEETGDSLDRDDYVRAMVWNGIINLMIL